MTRSPQPSEPVELAPSETAGSAAGLNALSEPRRAVLVMLKESGEASADEIARSVGVTLSAVRQQLGALEADGLVAHRDERPGPGRPRRRYCLAPAAESLWPKRYGQLANQLLGFAERDDPDVVDRVFNERGRERLRRALARLDGLELPARVTELTRILDEDGYLAQCTPEAGGTWLIVEHNCAILDVAARYGAACDSEITFIRAALPEATVERIKHKMAGDFVCAYRIAS